MRTSRIVLAITFAMTTLLLGLPLAAAQTTTTQSTFTSLISGAVIDLGSSGEATFIEGSHDIIVDNGNRQEEIMIAHGRAKYYVAIVDPGVTAAKWDSDTIGNMAPWAYRFEILATESQQGSNWSLYRYVYYLNFEEISYGEFHQSQIDGFSVVTMVFSDESTIVDEIDWAQQNITVGELPVVSFVELDQVASIVDGSSDVDPQVVEGYGTTAADWEEYGLVSDSEWISPNYGTVIAWDTSLWSLRYYKSNAIDIVDEEQDEHIYLVTPDNRGLATVRIYQDAESRTPEELVKYWTSKEYLDPLAQWRYTPIDSVLSDTTGSVILTLKQAYGEDVVMIRDVYIDANGNTVVTSIYAAPEDIGGVYEDYWNGVTADGEYYPLTWTLEEIHALDTD